MRELGCHEFDRARFLTHCEFERVATQLDFISWPDYPNFDADGNVRMLAKMSNGVAATVAIMTTSAHDSWQTLVTGTEGSVMIANDQASLRRPGEPEAVNLPLTGPDAAAVAQEEAHLAPWRDLIADFVGAVRSGDVQHVSHPLLPTFDDGLRTQAVIAAAEASDNQHTWVTVA